MSLSPVHSGRFSSLQVPDMLQQRAGGRVPEPLLRVGAGPGVAVLLLSLQQEVPLFLLVSLGPNSAPPDSCRGQEGSWGGGAVLGSKLLSSDKPGIVTNTLEMQQLAYRMNESTNQ